MKKIIYWLFGSKAHTENSTGYIWRGKYLVFKGHVNPGDSISIDVQEFKKIQSG